MDSVSVPGYCMALVSYNIIIHNLSISSFPVKYIPYKATVSARTSVGEGEPSSVVFFTLEGGEDSINFLIYQIH